MLSVVGGFSMKWVQITFPDLPLRSFGFDVRANYEHSKDRVVLKRFFQVKKKTVHTKNALFLGRDEH